MKISKASDYAIRGLIYMAKKPEGAVSYIKDIAKNTNTPASFMSKIFQTLSKAGLVNSFIGTKGGFSFNFPPKKITIKMVIEAIEGPIALNRCVINKAFCQQASHCEVHFMWIDIQRMLSDALSSNSIADFANKKLPRKGKKIEGASDMAGELQAL
ncbi:MAG: Rrf2 family transcriptional regulator [Deltaproteobacteria bacterium]|nr:Rrf2 family transcriptional regulator [Deltaproteobacteria bacterium]MCL5879948.1 Rrf2 family transcriptional regulator [Deltaproteobacteria bacterium]MDA8304349.1 Rrf2 family transcriptional regulator [Deltaproteobacteria bacterium]